MNCTLCRQRTARRSCPALGHDICAVCCGTKREVEIRCPSDCPYLTTARAHPASVVRRQQEQDARVFFAAARDLTDEQAQLLLSVLGFVRDYHGEELLRVTDPDLESAAIALAASYGTAAKGLIYEERPQSLAAQRLAADLRSFLQPMANGRGSSFDRDMALVFRAVQLGVQGARKNLEGGETAYLALLRRLIVHDGQKVQSQQHEHREAEPPSMLIRP
jgi:hypothetical protein